MERNKNILPSHWQLKKLGEVCKIIMGQSPPSNTYNKIGDGLPFFQGKAEFSDLHPIVEKWCSVPNKIADVNDILLSVRAPVGATNIADTKCCIGRGLAAIRFENYKYVFYYLKSIEKYLDTKGTGTTFKAISGETLRNVLMPIPPLPEQHAIVSKIEQLLSELDNGKQQLLTAQQQLKVYRQSLLKWAFEGKLTNKNVKEGELPKGWKIVKLSELGNWKGGGTPSKQISKYWENGSNLWVTSKDMKIGVINDSINKITDEAILNSSANRIPKGAILFVMRSGILRHTFPVAIAGKDLTVNQDLQTLSPNGLATSEFIYWFIRAFNNDIRQKCSKDGTTVESIESSSLKKFPFILPPLQEQQKIVSVLESKLTVCDKMEETISQSLQQAETLRQSILKKAFEGKLVTAVAEQKETKVIPLYKPKNEYFYQMQLLGIVAKASKQKQIEHGEMTLAKYAYLMDKVYGVPTYFNYNRWHLGPYPPTIKKVINNKQYFKKSGNHIEVLNEKTLFNSTNPNTEKMKAAVNDLTDIFSKYTVKERSHKTELLATVCKVIEDIQSTDLKVVRQSMAEWKINLKGEKHKTKAEKFNEAETEKCLAFIKEKGWDKKLMK